MQIRRVMLATDFSPAAEAAAPVARALATQASAQLHVVHAVPPLTDSTRGADQLARAAAGLAPCEPALLHGRPAREVLRYARDNAIDLVVLASHGRSGISQALLGGVAEEVVRLAPCLVLSVPATFALPAAERPATEQPSAARRCVACARETEELICPACRDRIRGEALHAKLDAERPARHGG